MLGSLGDFFMGLSTAMKWFFAVVLAVIVLGIAYAGLFQGMDLSGFGDWFSTNILGNAP